MRILPIGTKVWTRATNFPGDGFLPNEHAPRPNIDLTIKLYCILGLHQLAREGDNVRGSQTSTRPRNMERAYKIHHDNVLQ